MSLIKVAYLMLNFLNLKSFLRHLFFGVASCLSTLWIDLKNTLLRFYSLIRRWFREKEKSTTYLFSYFAALVVFQNLKSQKGQRLHHVLNHAHNMLRSQALVYLSKGPIFVPSFKNVRNQLTFKIPQNTPSVIKRNILSILKNYFFS